MASSTLFTIVILIDSPSFLQPVSFHFHSCCFNWFFSLLLSLLVWINAFLFVSCQTSLLNTLETSVRFLMVIASIPVLLYKINGRLYFSRNHLERSLWLGTGGGARLYVSLCGQVQPLCDASPFCPCVAQSPVVAIMTTGGGMRSLTALYGSLRGLKKLNILDCATYLTGLSGTTWWVALGSPWLEAPSWHRSAEGGWGSCTVVYL